MLKLTHNYANSECTWVTVSLGDEHFLLHVSFRDKIACILLMKPV